MIYKGRIREGERERGKERGKESAKGGGWREGGRERDGGIETRREKKERGKGRIEEEKREYQVSYVRM